VRRRFHALQSGWAAVSALFVGVSLVSVQPADAASDSGTDQDADTTSSLSGGYTVEGPKSNPVTKQITETRAQRATSQCFNQRTCASASSQEVTTQADNVGAGRVKHGHPSAATLPDSTVESSAGWLTIGGTSSGNTATDAESSQSSVSYPILSVSDYVAYRRTTTTEPNGTGAVSHTLSYKADVPVPEHSQEVDSAWSTFGIASPAAGQRICLGNVALSYDTGGDLDRITFTHVTEGSADGSISGVAAGTAVTTVVTTTLGVSVLSDSDRNVANTYAKSVLLSSGSINVPTASLAVDSPSGKDPNGTFLTILASKAATTQLVVNGTAITDNGGFDALSGSWSTAQLTAGRQPLASQTQ
jgi:hypothetical protein